MAILFVGSEGEGVNPVFGSRNGSTAAANHEATYTRLALDARNNLYSFDIPFETALPTEFWFHAYLFADWPTTPSGEFLRFKSGAGDTATPQIKFEIVNASPSRAAQIRVRKTADGTTYTTVGSDPGFTIPANGGIHIDFQIKTGGTGFIRVFISQIMVFEFVGDVTINAGITHIQCRSFLDTSSAFWSQFVVSDTTTLGARVAALALNATGTYTAWTGAFGNIDDSAAANGGYDEADSITTNAIDTNFSANFVDLTSGQQGTRTIKALSIVSRGTIQASSTPTNLKHLLRSASTDYLSANLNPPTNGTVKVMYTVYETDPATASPWTLANINAAQVGLRTV